MLITVVVSYHTFNNFEMIADGHYGPIYKVEYNNEPFVMKQYLKDKVILSRAIFSVMNELVFHKNYNMKSNFLVKLRWAVQDNDAFYLIHDILEGGNLRFHMNKRSFSEDATKFILACLIKALEFLHKRGLAYRNLKPENILLDRQGYVRLTDFKLLRESSHTNYFDSCGTPGYMAPEIIFRQNHGCSSDIFSLGVIAFELMMQRLPYRAKSRKAYIDHLLEEPVQIKDSDIPEGWSEECAEFINRCIQRRAANRLGYDCIDELKKHLWFQNFDWGSLDEQKMKPPYIPRKKRNYMLKMKEQNKEQQICVKPYKEYLEVCKMFEGYYFDYLRPSPHKEDENKALLRVREEGLELSK